MDKPSIYLGDSVNGSDVIISGNTSTDQFAQALGGHWSGPLGFVWFSDLASIRQAPPYPPHVWPGLCLQLQPSPSVVSAF